MSNRLATIAAVEIRDLKDLASRLKDAESDISTVRDLARMYCDLAHELPEGSRSIKLDADAFRGVMTYFTSQLDNAIERLAQATAQASVLADGSDT